VELTDLRTILAVANAGGFRRAATQLAVGQSVVSKRVRALEDELGVSLFERNREGARLTHAGRNFVERARSVVAEIDAAAQEARCAGIAANGRLNLGIVTSLSTGRQRELLTAFRDAAPEVRVELREGERDDLLARLADRRLDLVILTGEVSAVHGDSLLAWSELVYVALPVQHPLSEREALGWSDLLDESFIVTAAEPGPEIHEHIVRRLADLGRHPAVTRFAVGRETLMNMVGLGFGITFAGESWAAVEYPGVAFRPIRDGSEPLLFTIAWRHTNDNPALRRFISLARVLSRDDLRTAPSQEPDLSP
jgi:DNA-binding transcriptional LysR family regulator